MSFVIENEFILKMLGYLPIDSTEITTIEQVKTIFIEKATEYNNEQLNGILRKEVIDLLWNVAFSNKFFFLG